MSTKVRKAGGPRHFILKLVFWIAKQGLQFSLSECILVVYKLVLENKFGGQTHKNLSFKGKYNRLYVPTKGHSKH